MRIIAILIAMITFVSFSSHVVAQNDDFEYVTFTDGESLFSVAQFSTPKEAKLLVEDDAFVETVIDALGLTDVKEVDLEGNTLKGADAQRSFTAELDGMPVGFTMVADDEMIFMAILATIVTNEDSKPFDPLFEYLIESMKENELADIPDGFEEVEADEKNDSELDATFL